MTRRRPAHRAQRRPRPLAVYGVCLLVSVAVYLAATVGSVLLGWAWWALPVLVAAGFAVLALVLVAETSWTRPTGPVTRLADLERTPVGAP